VGNVASYAWNGVERFGRVYVNGLAVATLAGPVDRTTKAVDALNAAFGAGDDFEFCTPSWWSDGAPYAVVTVRSARRSDPATWYKSDRRLIVAATPDDSAYPWWTVLRWAQNIRSAIVERVGSLYLPPGYGTAKDGASYTNRRGSNYGCGEPLNAGTANLEFFHCCDLTVAITASIYEVPDRTSRWVRVTYPSTGKSAVLRVNDVGPAAWTGRAIDLTCRGSTRALGTYRTDAPITFQFLS
jgi:hypothetical protein